MNLAILILLKITQTSNGVNPVHNKYKKNTEDKPPYFYVYLLYFYLLFYLYNPLRNPPKLGIISLHQGRFSALTT